MLDDPGDDAEGVDVLGAGLIDLGVVLGGQEDPLVRALEGALEGHHRWPAADHERRHHVGEDHHVPQVGRPVR